MKHTKLCSTIIISRCDPQTLITMVPRSVRDGAREVLIIHDLLDLHGRDIVRHFDDKIKLVEAIL
jgi:hypothetical protein